MALSPATRWMLGGIALAAAITASACSRIEVPNHAPSVPQASAAPVSVTPLSVPGGDGDIDDNVPITPGSANPSTPHPVCAPSAGQCVQIEPTCARATTPCIVADLTPTFPANFFDGSPMRSGLSLAERHPRWRGASDDTPRSEIAWRNWAANGTQKGPLWTSVTMAMDLKLRGKDPALLPAAFFTDVAFHPLSPTFGWSRVALLGWTKNNHPILLTNQGPATLLSADFVVAAPNTYLVIDKPSAQIIARIAAPRTFQNGRFIFKDRKNILYWSNDGANAQCLKAFGPGLGMLKQADIACEGAPHSQDDGDIGLAQSDQNDLAIVRRAAPRDTARADALGCGSDAAGRVFRVADDPSILVYAAHIICD